MCTVGGTSSAPGSMLNIQLRAQFCLNTHKVPVGIETDPSRHVTEVWNIHMAQTGEAIAIGNNELKQEKAGMVEHRLSNVNL